MVRIQEWIYKLEVGEGTRLIRLLLAILALLALVALYDLREYKNFSTAEAMDSAQLARNIAEGKGFTTLFIRPFSIHLVEQRQIEVAQRTNDFALLKSGHPDLANPPVYPTLLAGLMKVLPFQWDIKAGIPFSRYQPEVLIALFNQALFVVAIVLVFRLALRLFDATVAWISVLVLAGSDLFWRFSVSGLSTMLLFVWLADSSGAGLFRALLRAASRDVVPRGAGSVRRRCDAVAGAELQYVRNTVRHGGLRDCAGYPLTIGRPPGTFVKTQLRRLVAARLPAEALIERRRDASARVAKIGRQRDHRIFSGGIDGAVCQRGLGSHAYLFARIARGSDPSPGAGANAFIHRLTRDQLGKSAGIAGAADLHIRRWNVFAAVGQAGTAACTIATSGDGDSYIRGECAADFVVVASA